MQICNLAKVVFLLSVITISFDTYIFGFSRFTMLMNILFTIFLVFITNWSCYNQTNRWVAWIVVIFSVLSLAAMGHLIRYPNDEINAKILKDEKTLRENENKTK